MKLNGASKPRQGASKQGSSPGVVLKGYRVKRYLKLNKNVVHGLPLNARGSTNKKSVSNDNNLINCNYISNDKQQRANALISQQTKQTRKCVETFSRRSISNKNSLTRIDTYMLISLKKQSDFKTFRRGTTQLKVSAITKTESCQNNLNNKIAAAADDAAVAAEAVKTKNIKRKTNIQKDSRPEAIINITTRQIINFKLEEESVRSMNNNNNIVDKRLTRQINNSVTETKSLIHNNRNNNPKAVNKFLFVSKLNAYPNLKANLLRLFIQLRLLLFSLLLHAIRYLKGGASKSHSKTLKGCRFGLHLICFNFVKMMRASQLLFNLFERTCLKNAKGPKPPIALYVGTYALIAILLPQAVVGDDGDTFFPVNGIETTTPEFDYASRGQKKFGDKCENTLECGFPGSICDPKKKSCQCTEDLPVTNHIDKCGKEAAVNESCFFNEQCEVKYFQTECRDQRCVCRFDMTPIWLKDGSVECKGRGDKKGPETYIDPAMIGVLIGMALMFIIICVVLRLFSQARWRENRTIFNTPNPRLMNVSLLRESKLLHGQERRGSRMSVRAPSRQPSMASLRPHSPNPSLGKTGSRSNSHGSNASATSIRSTRSNCVSPAGITVGNNSHHERKGSTYQPHQHHHPQQQKLQTVQQQDEEPQLMQTNIISNPVAETVTVEIIEPEKFTKSSE